jgi:hypothetical protein
MDPPNPKTRTTLQLLACFVYNLCQNETRLLFIRIECNVALRGTFLHKRDEITGQWRKTHNAEFYDL